MLDKLSKILFSTRLTAILFIVFAAAMATGTILDAGQDMSPTPYTRTLIYNTWWFEAIMVFFIINFAGNIFRYRLYKKEKWATLILHISFIFILLGAFITRYFGYEGMMPIREGVTENKFYSRETYLTTFIDGDYMVDELPQRRVVEEEVDFSPRLNNTLKINTDYNKQPITIELVEFMPNAEKGIIPDDNGENYLKLVEAGGGQPHNHFLKEGSVENVHNVLFALNKPTKGAVNITNTDGQLTIESPFEGEYLQMATGNTGKLVKDSLQPLMLRSRYVIGNMQLVFPNPVVKGKFDIVKRSSLLKKATEDGIKVKVSTKGESKIVTMLGGQGTNNKMEMVNVGGLDFALKYGAKVRELPFSIKLNDFIAEKYPGTENSYSSYKSRVSVIDSVKGDFDYDIYMNHVLDHGGYRFFQANFDPDEKGTGLSVNHDWWGTYITYFGYIMLYLGLMAILFTRGTRFKDLEKQLEKIKTKKQKMLSVLLIGFSLIGFAQHEVHNHDPNDGHNHTQNDEHEHVKPFKPSKTQVDSILKANVAPVEHAEKFGYLVIQDIGGRMMPMDTYASELLRKVHHKNNYEGFTPNQVVLSINESPMLWYSVPMIYLKAMQTDSLKKIIGIPKSQGYATLLDFFDDRGNYKLGPYLEDAYRKQIPNGHEKEIKLADQKVNLLSNAIDGTTLKIFPVPNDENNKWISPIEFRNGDYRTQIKDSLYGNFINSGFGGYLFTLNEAKQTGDFEKAEKLLEAFNKTQHKYGGNVMLSDTKIETEITYNKSSIFQKLYRYYLLFGFLMFTFIIVQIFYSRSKFVNIAVNVGKWLLILLFIAHTVGLISRWYISGHAPWSDTYETMLYVAWSSMFFGLAFGRKSNLTIASTAFVASIILFFAHQNWLDPAIANLQPVLNSYWIMIHVSIIVASYGPFILGMILGLVALLLMIFTNKNNKAKMDINIKELTVINEMSLTVGLVMLTIGNFLGGMWANESWGRYWGWDPKETWALISIMIYAFVIHMRLVPGLRGRWLYNVMSVFTVSSILMTYFGVNFYLAGLHSYASGDQVMSAKVIAICVAVATIISALAYRKYRLHFK